MTWPALRLVALTSVTLLLPSGGAGAATYSVLYTFSGGSDGGTPYAGLARDSAGNLYGTTEYGGNGYGTAFELTPDGSSETVRHAFNNDGTDGTIPQGGVQLDSKGNLYGTTNGGGGHGDGVIFRIASDGSEKILHDFAGGTDGSAPVAGLNKFFGTTSTGGKYNAGTIFSTTKRGGETVVHVFSGTDGTAPYAGVIGDGAGSLYGTTLEGGTYGYGTVFRLAPDGTLTPLYEFSGGSDGAYPYGGVKFDNAGNLYGTTSLGGTSGFGVIFKLAPNGQETVLHSFAGGASDGAYPYAGAIVNGKGTTIFGSTSGGGANSRGTVFSLRKGSLQILHSFAGGADGSNPRSDLTPDGAGNLYGTTLAGGQYGYGTVFKVSEK